MTIIYEFPSEDGDIGPLVSNKILWLKYKVCPIKSCFSAIFLDLDRVYLIGMLCNHCIILQSKLGHSETKNFD